MGTLTVRNLDDPTKQRLRLKAAANNRSMEEEARQILRAALSEPAAATNLAHSIRARFKSFGDVQLLIEARQAVRDAPLQDRPAAAKRRTL